MKFEIRAGVSTRLLVSLRDKAIPRGCFDFNTCNGKAAVLQVLLYEQRMGSGLIKRTRLMSSSCDAMWGSQFFNLVLYSTFILYSSLRSSAMTLVSHPVAGVNYETL